MSDSFLTSAEQIKIDETIRNLEQNTSGEILVLIVPGSDDYVVAAAWASMGITIPMALSLSAVIGPAFWLSAANMWVFLSLMAVLFPALFLIMRRSPAITRFLVSKDEMEQNVEEEARSRFFSEGLFRTKDATGVLIFISLLERQAHIIGDRGIDAVTSQEEWKEILNRMTAGIRSGNPGASIVEAVEKIGNLLTRRLPPGADDVDEVRNLIIEKDA